MKYVKAMKHYEPERTDVIGLDNGQIIGIDDENVYLFEDNDTWQTGVIADSFPRQPQNNKIKFTENQIRNLALRILNLAGTEQLCAQEMRDRAYMEDRVDCWIGHGLLHGEEDYSHLDQNSNTENKDDKDLRGLLDFVY